MDTAARTPKHLLGARPGTRGKLTSVPAGGLGMLRPAHANTNGAKQALTRAVQAACAHVGAVLGCLRPVHMQGRR